MRVMPAILVKFLMVLPQDLIGGMYWPTVKGEGLRKLRGFS